MAVSGRPLYLLDTNIIGYIANGRSQRARTRLKEALAHGEVMISTITQAEILFGLAESPEALRLRASVDALLTMLQVRPWDTEAATAYAKVRAGLDTTGRSLSLMDLLIASHAVASDAILVSHDQAFTQLAHFLTVVDWATDI